MRLVALGHRVPAGFVVTVGALEATLEHLGLAAPRDAVSRALATAGDLGAGETVRRGLEGGRLPERVLSKIVKQVDDLGLWAGHAAGLIVRSSATVEDSAAHSFAGIFESIQIERPDELEPAIREVWASLFSPRALGYAPKFDLARGVEAYHASGTLGAA